MILSTRLDDGMAHTAQELELLALAAEERRRNASTEQPQAPAALPDLTPEMLMSASARREVEAAQGWMGRPTGVAQAMTAAYERQPRPMSAREFRASQQQGFDIESSDLGDIDLDSEPAAMTPNEDAMLSSLFMGREAQEAASVLGGGYNGGGRHGFDIEFDSDSMLEGRTAPNESARWQVGRQSPPASNFQATRVSGPSDGVVVSSRGGDGSWQRAASSQRPEPRPAPAAPRPASAPQRPAQSPGRPYTGPRPTVYDRIMRGGIVDDD